MTIYVKQLQKWSAPPSEHGKKNSIAQIPLIIAPSGENNSLFSLGGGQVLGNKKQSNFF